MAPVLPSLLRALPAGPLHAARAPLRQPIQTQRQLLRELLQRASSTEWGLRFGFAGLASASDVAYAYQRRVPLHSYDDLREDAERVRAGAADVMWPGTFKHFAVSSGTASSGKVIPVSTSMLDHMRTFSVGAGLNYLEKSGSTRFLFGKHLTLPGRIEEDEQYPGTLVGEVSGLVAEHAPSYFRQFFQAVPNEVAFLPNWEKKLSTIAERTAHQDIRLVVMAPTWALVLFRRLLETYNETHGAEATTVGEVWPNLEVFISGGVALRSYRTLLEAQIGLPQLQFVETYGASEGFFSFQNDLDDPAMLLHLDSGVFYEFVPLGELGSDRPTRLTIAEVETDVRYALYVTTTSGLWAYGVGDVVRFTSTDPHKIVVAGRTSEMIDKYGEAVFGDEARAALEKACRQSGAHMVDYHVAPRDAAERELPAHQWLIEFDEAPDDLAAFAGAIDAHLQSVNRHYQIRREAQAFGAPEIVPVPPGTFYAWLRREKKHISGQTKVPRMSEERRVADGVLVVAGNNP